MTSLVKSNIPVCFCLSAEIIKYCSQRTKNQNTLYLLYPYLLGIDIQLNAVENHNIGRDSQLHTSLYDNHDDFKFHMTNFPFLSSNIPSSPTYGVFISQLIRYARACSSYECFILKAVQLSNKLLGQGYVSKIEVPRDVRNS